MEEYKLTLADCEVGSHSQAIDEESRHIRRRNTTETQREDLRCCNKWERRCCYNTRIA
jgi:hypothetical protein